MISPLKKSNQVIVKINYNTSNSKIQHKNKDFIFLLTFIELFVIIVAYETVAFATIKKSRGTLCQSL